MISTSDSKDLKSSTRRSSIKTGRESHTKLDPEEVMVEVYRGLEKLLLGEPGLVSMIIGVEEKA
jgi:hypothetical protein